MKSVAHQYEDKLLEFAYGELPQHEAEAVDAHVRGCNRCSQSLQEIRGVRAAMARLPAEPAPDTGLESLLAYAEQAAKRNAAASKPAPSFFKRFMMPLASLAALVTVGVVGFRASQEFETSPAAAMADQKVAAVEEAARQKKNEEQKLDESKAIAQPPADAKLPEVVAAVAPAPEAPANEPFDKSLEAKNDDSRSRNKDLAKAKGKELAKEGRVAASDEWDDDLNAAGNAGKKGDKGGYEQSAGEVWSPEPTKSAPQSNTKRAPKVDAAPLGNAEAYRQVKSADNFSDVGTRGAKMERQELAKAPPPPPAPPQEKPSFGLGTSSPGGGPQGVAGGASTRDFGDAPAELSQGGLKPSPAPAAPPPAKVQPKADPKAEMFEEKREAAALAQQQREESEKLAVAKQVESKKRAEEDRRAAEQQQRAAVAEPAPAPVAAAPMPSSSSYSLPSRKKSSGGYGIRPQLGSESTSGEGAFDDEAVQRSDSLGVNSDAKFNENTRRKAITQAVENARVASSRGDRMTEIRLLAQALESGATGYERVEALKRICDAYEALGEVERADPFCEQLMKEFPATAAAKMVSDRRKQQVKRAAPAPKKPAAPSERQMMLDDDAAKPAEAAPAQSY